MLYQEIEYLTCIGDEPPYYYTFNKLELSNYLKYIFYECGGEEFWIKLPTPNCSSFVWVSPECLFIPMPINKIQLIASNEKTKLLEQLWFELGSLENPTQRQIDWYIASINNLT